MSSKSCQRRGLLWGGAWSFCGSFYPRQEGPLCWVITYFEIIKGFQQIIYLVFKWECK